MKLNTEWLTDPKTVRVMQALEAKGNVAYFVGGCVRNGLMGLPTTDIDISTDALPHETTALAEAAELKAVPTGIDHGTITIVVDGEPFEVTSFRKDIETDGRRAVVAFSKNIKDDAVRRDFTVNAIYAQADGVIVDPLDGLPDLKRRHIRFIEDPDQRIAEDYLRILRFFRFTTQYGDPSIGIDADGLAACAAGADGLDTLAKERIGSEMRKILAAENPEIGIAAMENSGILARILPGSSAKFLPILVHIEQKGQINWLTRLAVLGGQDVRDNLRLTNAEDAQLQAILKVIEMGIRPSVSAFEHGPEVAISGALALAALTENHPPTDLMAEVERGAAAVFPIRASDLPDLQGKALGDHLKALRAEWVASDFSLSKEDML